MPAIAASSAGLLRVPGRSAAGLRSCFSAAAWAAKRAVAAGRILLRRAAGAATAASASTAALFSEGKAWQMDFLLCTFSGNCFRSS